MSISCFVSIRVYSIVQCASHAGLAKGACLFVSNRNSCLFLLRVRSCLISNCVSCLFVSICFYVLHFYSCLFVSILIGFVLSFRCIAHYGMCSFASSHAQTLYVCRLTCSNNYMCLRVYSCLFVSILPVSIPV